MSNINLFDTGRKLSYETLHLLTKGQKHIAECIVFTHEYDEERNIDFSYIKLCCHISVEECVDTIIQYARDNKFRLIEYPLLKLYSDGTFYSDNLEIHESDYDEVEIEDDHDYLEVVEQNKNNKSRRNINPSVAFKISQYVIQQYECSNRIQVTHTGSFIDVHATYQVLPNTFQYKTHMSTVSMSIGKYETIFNEESNDNVGISGKACIYNQKKAIDVWVEGNSYNKVVDTVNIDFLKSQVLVFDTFENGGDIYTKLYINNVPIKCSYEPNNHQYRINKWGRYSDIESYNIAFGYNNINSIKIKVINSLCFPGGYIDINYIDYTSQIYDDLLNFATLEGMFFKRKRPRQYVIIKKWIVMQNNENKMNTIEEYNTNINKDNDEDIPRVFDDNCLGYIYLLREREFFKTKENVYKVGRTIQKGTSLILDRLKAYKKGSELVLIRQVPCDNVVQIETLIVKEFQKNFTQHNDGREYFIGDVNKMVDIIHNISRK